MSKTIELLRDLATTFASLADEIEKRDKEVDSRFNVIENETYKNKEVLRTVANTILDNI